VTHLGRTAPANQKYWYDANGNVTRRINGSQDVTLTYDAENRLTGVSGGASANFVYNGDGQRVKQKVGATTTVFIGNYYEQTGSNVTKYYYANGQRVAMRTAAGVTYVHTDHLGSTSVTSGAQPGNTQYFPYGATRSGTVSTTYRFTGQRLDDSTGLYYYGARYYDAALGRFIQPDTIVPNPGNPQDLNRYTYARNNPLRFVDPSGYDPLDQAWRDEFRAVHGRDPTAEDMLIRLFSIAFPDEWNWSAFYTPDGQLREGAVNRVFSRAPVGRSWASVPGATERLAGWYNQNETEAFVRDIGSLFAGLRNRFEEPNGWNAITAGWVRDSVWVLREGLQPELVGTDQTGNVHHWAWSLNLGYFRGGFVGRVINEGREFRDSGWDWQRYTTDVNHVADVRLGNIGTAMGNYMRNWPFSPRSAQAIRTAWGLMPLTVSAR